MFFILALSSKWFLISLFIGNIESRAEGIYIGQCPRSGPSGSKRAYVGYIDDVSCDANQISLYFSWFSHSVNYTKHNFFFQLKFYKCVVPEFPRAELLTDRNPV